MVKVEGLTKRYGDHAAVEDISFTLESGKIYGLLGPNGAGKSTTMNMMTGYLAPTGGSVEVEGLDMDKEAKKAKSHIGYLPENPPLYPDMTVHEYLRFVAELKGVKKAERFERVESVMDETGVADMANRLIKNLSKGYKQRVGLAGAMLGEPSVIILDEPTVGLDPKQIIEFRELIKAFGEDKTVMISSHILSEISEVCDHVFIINNGHLIVDDDVENLDGYVSNETVITITIKGDASLACEKIRALSCVDEVQTVEENDNSSVVSVKASSSDDITERISLALMEERIPILGMSEEKSNLEQIFLEITQEDDEQAAEDESDEADKMSAEDESDEADEQTTQDDVDEKEEEE